MTHPLEPEDQKLLKLHILYSELELIPSLWILYPDCTLRQMAEEKRKQIKEAESK